MRTILARHRPERWAGIIRKPAPAWTGICTTPAGEGREAAEQGAQPPCSTRKNNSEFYLAVIYRQVGGKYSRATTALLHPIPNSTGALIANLPAAAYLVRGGTISWRVGK